MKASAFKEPRRISLATVLLCLLLHVIWQLQVATWDDSSYFSVSRATLKRDIGAEYIRRDEMTREDFMERFGLTNGWEDNEEQALKLMHKLDSDGIPKPILGHPFLFVGSAGTYSSSNSACLQLYPMCLFLTTTLVVCHIITLQVLP